MKNEIKHQLKTINCKTDMGKKIKKKQGVWKNKKIKKAIKGKQKFKNNASDTTNFTTKYLQNDMTSYVEDPHQQLKTQLSNNI